MSDVARGITIAFACVIILVSGVGGCMYGYPMYNVYSQKMDGEAKLAHSQYERQTQVSDAQGQLDAAKLLAQRDVERARGVAQANQIIGESLKNNESYIRWLFVEGLKETKNQVIYIPTETQLPILEASGLTKRAAPPVQ